MENGAVGSDPGAVLAERLLQLFDAVSEVISLYNPTDAAIEETFVNVNPVSTLKLGQARAAVILAPARAGIPVAEYLPNHVKKSLVGVGHAQKGQVQSMVEVLLPGSRPRSSDAADALAVAICHAHNRSTSEAVRTLLGEKS